MNKTWHQYQKYIIKLLNQHFALGFRQDTEKTGHHLGFARKFKGCTSLTDRTPCLIIIRSADHGTENKISAGKSVFIQLHFYKTTKYQTPASCRCLQKHYIETVLLIILSAY